jgi:hypothetical protein
LWPQELGTRKLLLAFRRRPCAPGARFFPPLRMAGARPLNGAFHPPQQDIRGWSGSATAASAHHSAVQEPAALAQRDIPARIFRNRRLKCSVGHRDPRALGKQRVHMLVILAYRKTVPERRSGCWNTPLNASSASALARTVKPFDHSARRASASGGG